MNPVLKALLLTTLGLLLVGGLVWVTTGGAPGLELPAMEWFRRYWSEEFQRADTLTAKRYLSSSTRGEYEKLRRLYQKRLGTFLGQGEVLEDTLDHDHGVVRVKLRFEKSENEIEAYFGFVQEEGEWLVERFRLELPRATTPERPGSDPRIFGTKIAEVWAKGSSLPAWQQFDEQLRGRWSADIFVRISRDLVADLGAFEKATMISFEETAEDHARLEVELVFEKGTLTATVQVAFRGGRWYATAFEVPGL